MDSLRIFALDDNLLDGDLAIVDDLEPMEFLYLEDNDFEHAVTSDFLQDLDKLIHLDISGNKLRGELPAHLFASANMKVLDLHDNDLRGPFPAVIEEQNTLEFVALHPNQLTGTLENSLGNLTKLLYLDLAHNNFTGALEEDGADGLGSLTGLKYLFLGGNMYEAQEFPPFLANLDGLLELSLKDSSLLGPIPEWIELLSGLYLLDLDGNLLSGPIPTEMGNLVDLQYLLLNRNELTGEVPSQMGRLSNLKVLLLDDNNLTGSLDDSVCEILPKTTRVAADCAGSTPEVACDSTCCSICCEDDGDPCNDGAWIANNNPVWEHGYGRYEFVFENEAN